MKTAIQLSVHEEARALPILLRHSPGMILPSRKYIMSDNAVQALRQAGIRFVDLSKRGLGSEDGSP